MLGAVLLGCLVLVTLVPWAAPEASGFAAYGALLQGVAGSLALVLVWRTLQLQREELRLQRRELKLTRDEMERSTAEQRRLANEAKEQREFMQEQAELAYRPLLRAILANHGSPRSVYVRNDGAGRAIVATLVYLEDGRVVSPDVRLTGRYKTEQPHHIQFDIERLTEFQVRDGEKTRVFEVRFQGFTAIQEAAFLDDVGRLTVRISYSDVWGRQQRSLRIPLASLKELAPGEHRILLDDLPGVGQEPSDMPLKSP